MVGDLVIQVFGESPVVCGKTKMSDKSVEDLVIQVLGGSPIACGKTKME